MPAALAAFCARPEVLPAQRAVALSDVWRASLGSNGLLAALGRPAVLDLFRSVGAYWSTGPWRDPWAILEHAVQTRAGWSASAVPVQLAARPSEPVVLYRGTAIDADPWAPGLSWTTDRESRGAVRPAPLLCRLSDYAGGPARVSSRCYAEVVLDPDVSMVADEL